MLIYNKEELKETQISNEEIMDEIISIEPNDE